MTLQPDHEHPRAIHVALCAVHTEACVGIVAINRPQLARR